MRRKKKPRQQTASKRAADAIRRKAREYYGIDLTRDDRRAMRKMIREGKATCLRRQSNTRSVYSVTVRETQIIVLYNHEKRELAGVLKPKKGKPKKIPENPPEPAAENR